MVLMQCRNCFIFFLIFIALGKCKTQNFNKLGAQHYKINVLMIVVDDLRPLMDENIINLPNLNSLARKSVYFENAFAQQALCAPSRNSFLTGRRPDSLHLYDFYNYWRDTVGNFTTIPQFFKENGYNTFSVGKIFHPGLSSNFTDDYPYSWSTSTYHPPTERYSDWPVCRYKPTNTYQRNVYCPVYINIQPENTLPDLQSLQKAVEILESVKNMLTNTFLAVGFHKPHLPLKFPKEYLDRVPRNSVSLPDMPFKPSEMPTVAWHPWTDLKKRDDIRNLNISFPFGIMPPKWSRKVRRAYIASALYIDDLIGILMRHVDNNTIVVLTSDHGWSLGENGLWAKYSNFDYALKVPLLLSYPGVKPKVVKTPVELIDLFPTLVDLANISNNVPRCTSSNDKTKLCFQGKSLAHLLDDYSESPYEGVALSQYPRPSVNPRRNSDKPRLQDIKIMGYSLRTDRFRYTEWISFNNTLFKRDWDKIYGIELYDHYTDPIEAVNLNSVPQYRDIKNYLSQLLREKVEQ